MKAYGESDVWLHASLNNAERRSVRSPLRHGICNQFIGTCVEPRAGLDVSENKISPFPQRESITIHRLSRPHCSNYIECATLALFLNTYKSPTDFFAIFLLPSINTATKTSTEHLLLWTDIADVQ